MVDADLTAPVADGTVRPPQLPRELSEFLVELSLAMHKHAIYPRGHPLLAQSVDAVHRSLTGLLTDRPALSIGVARKQLIIEGVASGPSHPLLGELANKFHRHHIGALKFIRGLTREELSSALETVGIEPQKDEHPLGMRPDVLETLWTNVKMFPLTYDRLELLDEDESAELEAQGTSPEGRGYAAQLWVGLATAAIAADRGDETPMDPEQVAAAIDAHDREPAYDQVIVGYLLQIAREVRQDDTQVNASIGLKRRISKLVGALQPDTLRRLLDMGGDSLQRRQFVLDATLGMSVDAIVDLVKAAASAEGQTISTSLVRMLTKLATHAGGEPTTRSRNADGEFRAHVERLVTSWSLDDPNPLAYSAALEQMSRNGADAASGPDARYPCEPTRIVAMALELDVVGESVARAVTNALRDDLLGELLDLLDAAPVEHVATIEYVWALIDAAEPLPALLAMPRIDHQLARRVVVRSGLSAAPALLAWLDAATEGAQRDRLMGYLASLGPDVAPAIGARLQSAHPSLAREFLTCLIKLAPATLPTGARSFLTHAEPALRREATKLLLAYEETREHAMSVALRDDDERVIYAGLLAAQDTCSPAMAATIRERMDRGEIAESAARAAGVRAVAHIIDDDTLEWLLKRVVVAGGILRRARLAPTSPELLAALNVLALRWEHHPMATPALEQARASTSSTVRTAAQAGGFKAHEERGRTT